MGNNFCSQCGSALVADARFCPNCGQSVQPTAQPQTYTPLPSSIAPPPSYDAGTASQKKDWDVGTGLPWYIKMLLGVGILALIKLIAC